MVMSVNVAMTMWTTIDDDLQQMAEANARVQAAARKHHPQSTARVTTKRFAEEEYKRVRRYPQKSKKRKIAPPPMDDDSRQNGQFVADRQKPSNRLE